MQDRDPSSPRPSPRYIVFPVVNEPTIQIEKKPSNPVELAEIKIAELNKQIGLLQTQCQKITEENAKLVTEKNKLGEALKSAQEIFNKHRQNAEDALTHSEREKKILQQQFYKQVTQIQNELKQKQQSLNETIDILKKNQEDLEYARKDVISINESYILEQRAHQETCEELKEFSREWAEKFKQQSDYFGNKLSQANNEIERLRNVIKTSINTKSYSAVVKDGMFKENKSLTDDKIKSQPSVKKP